MLPRRRAATPSTDGRCGEPHVEVGRHLHELAAVGRRRKDHREAGVDLRARLSHCERACEGTFVAAGSESEAAAAAADEGEDVVLVARAQAPAVGVVDGGEDRGLCGERAEQETEDEQELHVGDGVDCCVGTRNLKQQKVDYCRISIAWRKYHEKERDFGHRAVLN